MADGTRDDERGEPDQRTSLVPVPAKPRQRSLLPWPRKGGARAAGTGDAAQQRGQGRVRAFFGVVADRVVETAPRIPVRDLETLRKQFPGLGPEEIADKLVAGAVRGSATVGAGVGAAAMLPVPPAMPAELAAEIVGVASVELKLIAELHEVYGRRPPGNVKQRAAAYLGAWTSERGIDITRPTTLNAALGGQMKRELRQQLLKRTVRNLPNLTPFMVGAAVGAVMNSRDTKKIAEKIRDDLRKAGDGWEALPPGDGGDGLDGGPGPGSSGRAALPPSSS
ncbi:EcsC family protein [Streptomyces marispadix]|uniref:EcsC family protein n=1 Tax=Streptomyces marispadix TaxID=2922868 RepID=A0ABS9T3H0_9ACTN|nr:EcsC family protein [Streptomyces marispadix]MCH6163069.1 EcsC family protein [Streptomyces marispadix]